MWKRLSIVIILTLILSEARGDNDWPYYKAWVISQCNSNSSFSSNTITYLYKTNSSSTGYVQKVSSHVYSISFPSQSTDGSNAWVWIQVNSNKLIWVANDWSNSVARGITSSDTNRWNFSGSSTNISNSLWVYNTKNQLTPNTNATVTLDMYWKFNSKGQLTPRSL